MTVLSSARHGAALGLLALALAATPAAADTSLQGPLKEVGFDQKLGAQLPLDALFVDETGREVALGTYFGRRPVILALVYYDCPMLCNLTLNGLTSALRVVDLVAGGDYEVVVVSIDPRERAPLAAAKKAMLVDRLGARGDANSWHLLTGKEPEILRLASAVGFRYVYDERRKEYAHAAGVIVNTPHGTVSKYFYGSEFAPRDLRLGLVDSAAGKVGTAVDQLLLYCFHYDPQTGRYSAAVLNLVRLGGLATVVALGLFLALSWRRDRAAAPAPQPARS